MRSKDAATEPLRKYISLTAFTATSTPSTTTTATTTARKIQ